MWPIFRRRSGGGTVIWPRLVQARNSRSCPQPQGNWRGAGSVGAGLQRSSRVRRHADGVVGRRAGGVVDIGRRGLVAGGQQDGRDPAQVRRIVEILRDRGTVPASPDEVPPSGVAYLAEQLRVDADGFADYAWSGRTIEYHRAQV